MFIGRDDTTKYTHKHTTTHKPTHIQTSANTRIHPHSHLHIAGQQLDVLSEHSHTYGVEEIWLWCKSVTVMVLESNGYGVRA
jgi:hypothetical protein